VKVLEQEEELPEPVKKIKEGIEARIEAETIGVKLLEELQPIVEGRRKLREAEDNLVAIISRLEADMQELVKEFHNVNELKLSNLKEEHEMFADIRKRLNAKQ
jgi:hypothetical protein